ncbi:hypothetical protein IW148_003502 [Coemansia sp. RSA 1199]|nr:hypothetical protein IW148_003502 [Coemansia sp. RSA 1199]
MGYLTCVEQLWKVDVRVASEREVCELIEQCRNQLDSTLDRTHLVSSLAVAGAFSDVSMAYVTPRVHELADKWTASLCSILDLNNGLGSSDFNHMCTHRVHLYFSSPKQPQYKLMHADIQPELMGEPEWKKHEQCVGAFMWALGRLDASAIRDSVAFALPVTLALADDYEYRMYGLRASCLFVRDTEFARRSGTGSVLLSSIRTCLVYRSDAPQPHELLHSAFTAFTTVADAIKVDVQEWWALCDALVVNYGYVGDKVNELRVVCGQISIVCERLGVCVARYLRAFVGIVTHALEAGICVVELQQVAAEQVTALARACPQRVCVYVPSVVAALARAWDSAGNDSAPDKLRDEIHRALASLRETDADAVSRAVRSLQSARPSHFDTW